MFAIDAPPAIPLWLLLKSKVFAVFSLPHRCFCFKIQSFHTLLFSWLVGWLVGLRRSVDCLKKKKSSRAHVSFFIAFAHWHFALRAFLYILQFFMDESQIKISKNFSRSNEICVFFLKPIINIVKQFVK